MHKCVLIKEVTRQISIQHFADNWKHGKKLNNPENCLFWTINEKLCLFLKTSIMRTRSIDLMSIDEMRRMLTIQTTI